MVSNKTKTDRKNTLVIWRGIMAAVIIMSLVVARQVIMQNSLSTHQNLSSIAQVASEQKSLSQSIVKDIYRLFFTEETDAPSLIDSINTRLDLLTETQKQLLIGSTGVISGIPLSEHTESALLIADSSLLSVSERLAGLLQRYNPAENNLPLQEILELDAMSQKYLLEMEQVIGTLNDDISRQDDLATIVELILFFLVILSVMTLIVFVLLPDQKMLYQSYEQVRHLGERDRMTNLLNQFSFHEHVAADMKSKKQHGLTLLFIDIDDFSGILQKKGQLVADDVLRRTAAVVNTLLREGDYAARLSSDTFAIVLHMEEDADAESYVKMLIRDMSSLDIPAVGKITACVGVSKHHAGEPLIDWLDRANQALRQAKQEGRGRIVFEHDLRSAEFVGTVKWSEQWESGHPLIDEQHKALIQLGNQLITEALPTGDIVKEEELLEKVIREMINHFVCEEKIMRECKYPETTAHEVTHELLIAKAFQMEEEFHKRILKAGFVFNFVVEEIIVGHIATEDVKYFPYLKKPEGDSAAESVSE